MLGEVNFPNLQFDRTRIDFDCILNHSEVSQFVRMHNTSPLEVKYCWTLLIGDQPNIIFHRKRPVFIEELEPNEVILDASEKDRDTEKDEHDDVSISEDGYGMELRSGKIDSANMMSPVLEMKLELNLSDSEAENYDRNDEMKQLQLENMEVFVPIMVKPSHPEPFMNEHLKALLEAENEMIPLGIEEIFDVKPLFGTIGPNEFEQITFTYFGHADVEAHVNAICEVEGGPTYRFELNGEASTVQYKFNELHFDFDQVPYNQVGFKDLILTNLGKVRFEFTSKGASSVLPENQYPMAQPILVPVSGFVEAGSQILIKVGYLSGSPGKFSDHCQIQVAHFPMDTIEISGHATFPRVTIDLPRDEGIFIDPGNYNEDFMLSTKQLFDSHEPFSEILESTRKELADKNNRMSDEQLFIHMEDLAVANQPKKEKTPSTCKRSSKKGTDK